MTKYNKNDKKETLALSDDAAAVNWEGDWRMPTSIEQDELLDKTTWDWTTINGINGYKVTGPNGKSIFLFAAGYYLKETLHYAGMYGSYSSSSIYEKRADCAYASYFGSEIRYCESDGRCAGRSVCPVCKGVTSDSPSNIDNVTLSVPITHKVLENGILYILRNGEKYTIDGRRVE